jgi:hypothetical protein
VNKEGKVHKYFERNALRETIMKEIEDLLQKG